VVAADAPRVTVTTVLFKSAPSLPAYAAALRGATEEGVVRVVAVDNASPDTSAALFAELLPGAEVIDAGANLGFAGGCNLAWPKVETAYWLLLNPDVEAQPEGVRALVEWMDEHPRVGLASPALHDQHGRPQPLARPHDSLWRPLVEALRLHKLIPRRLRARWLLSGRTETPGAIAGWVPGAALIARTDAVREVGLLNETLFMYGEDREWCWRMRRAGWQIGVCEAVTFVHAGGTSAESTWGSDERVKREVEGHLRATRQMRGGLWTRMFAALVGATLRLESLDPRRDQEGRQDAARRGALYLRAGIRGL
jgi:GT2 family glycosyltransferase